jgi:hypothetical protein
VIQNSSHLRGEKNSRKYAAIAVVAVGYGGDMDEKLCNDLLDDIFISNKVKCRKRCVFVVYDNRFVLMVWIYRK